MTQTSRQARALGCGTGLGGCHGTTWPFRLRHLLPDDVLITLVGCSWVVDRLQDMGLKHYRLSFAMPRIFPGGKGPANEDGIDFYNRLINCLLEADITPMVTLYHWDLPLELQVDHGGWQSDITTQRFVEYAEVCFERFGDRVKNW